jgi:hypothetical protein
MDQENSQNWSVGCSDGWQQLECRGVRANTECGCQKWFGGSARYMKSECAFNFSRLFTTCCMYHTPPGGAVARGPLRATSLKGLSTKSTANFCDHASPCAIVLHTVALHNCTNTYNLVLLDQ